LRRGGSAGVAGSAMIEGPSRFSKLLDQLSAVEFTGTSAISESARALSSRRAPANLLVATDGLEPLESLEPLRQLSQKRTAITLVQILAPSELDPPRAGASRVFGLEEGETLALDLDASTIADYRAEMTRHIEALEAIAVRHGWAFAVTDSAADLRELMLGKLGVAG
jgi:hypothetical protein